MRANLLLISAVSALLFLGACDNDSSHHRQDDASDAPVSDDFADACFSDDVADAPVSNDAADIPDSDDDMVNASTGFLIDSAVSGVAYETPTHQGVTGLDGSFQYNEGETVRFMLGDTLLGEVTGQAQVTPFDLSGSEVITGINITWELERGEEDPFPAFFITDALESKGDLFYTVLNIAVLLQSLDQDADPVNGIEIRPAVAALFDGVSLDLSQDWETFRNEPALRHALWLANTQNLFNEAHGVVSPAPALKHLYDTLGINTRTVGISLEQWDSDYRFENTQYQYDASGNLTRAENDYDRDGTPEHIVSYQYDADGNITWEETLSDPGGTPNDVFWQYSPSGNPPRVEWDWNGDGVLDYIEHWQYDAEDNATQFTEWDEDDNTGLEATLSIREYYAEGNLTRVERVKRGEWNDPPWGIDSYEYDVRGHLTRHEQYQDQDATPAFIESWEYDANGKLTRHEIDEDGNPPVIESYEYDVNGNLARVEEGTRNDCNSWQFEYDTNGNLTRDELHVIHDDVLVGSESGQYQYDTSGNLTWAENDYDRDGTPDAIVNYEYDSSGILIRVVADDVAGDGNPIFIESYEYDANGILTRHERDEDGDGMPEFTRQYEATGWGHFFQISRPDDPRPPWRQ